MRKGRKIFAILLAMIMVISMAMPAMANTEANSTPDTYTVTIKNPLGSKAERTLDMYQIFKGTIKAADQQATEGENSGTSSQAANKTQVLSDIEWGSAFTGTAGDTLYAALSDTNESTGKYLEFAKTLQATIAAAEVSATDKFEELDKANQIAELLSKNNTHKNLIQEFANAVVEHAIDGSKVTLTASEDKMSYTTTDVEGGYYLIKDRDDSLNGTPDTYTGYIMQVVGDTEMTAKSGNVTVDKDIVDGATTEAADYSIGDEVHFRLIGSLPTYYSEYDEFEYIFHDTMSEGLTFTEAMKATKIKVSFENNGVAREVPKSINGVEVWHADIVHTPTAEDPTTKLDIHFPNLKDVTSDLGVTIDNHTKIIVDYYAILNENAIVGGNGNENSAIIEFSNDPHDTTNKGVTPPDTVYVFTLELDINKIDGSDSSKKLEGAEFILYRQREGKPQYAVLADDNVTIEGWTFYKTQEDIDADEKLTTDEQKAAATFATVLRTGNNGQVKVKGLEADYYYLEEITAPDGYNKIEGATDVNINVTVKETNSTGEVIIEDETGESAKIVLLEIKVGTNGEYEDGDKATGIVTMDVVNNPGSTLPETGGMGTTLFYLVGGAMALLAVVLLITKKRMSSEIQ